MYRGREGGRKAGKTKKKKNEKREKDEKIGEGRKSEGTEE